MGRHPGAVPGEAEALLRGGLHVHPLRVDVQRHCYVFRHLLSVGAYFRSLRQQRGVDVHHGAARFRQQPSYLRQQLQTGNTGVGRVRIRKQLADVPLPGSPRQSVHHGVDQYIRVSMA